MLIKKLIQRLLDSRTTPEEAVHANRRNTSSGVIVSTNTPYVCPTDGYITFSSRTENGVGIGTAIGIKINGIDTDLRTYPVDNSWNQSLTHPVSKADTVTFLSYGNAEISAKFFKALGGGYNLFIWRALSCLRALSNFSQRSFCKVDPNGLRHNVSPKKEYSCQRNLLSTFYHPTDTSAFTKTHQIRENLLTFTPLTQVIQFFQGLAWALRKDLLRIQESFLLQKDVKSLSITKKIQSTNYGFLRLSVAVNDMSAGGASC